jgi:hypothetical protein
MNSCRVISVLRNVKIAEIVAPSCIRYRMQYSKRKHLRNLSECIYTRIYNER